jgi:hypothetical protein
VPFRDDPVRADAPRTPEKITLMVEWIRHSLTMVERANLHRAISQYDREMILALTPHKGRLVTAEEWAQLMLTCAREVLEKADNKGTKP